MKACLFTSLSVHECCLLRLLQAYDAVKAASWPSMDVHALQPDEKMQIVTGYLEDIYGKTLSQEQKALIVEAPQTNNALYLKALMDEACDLSVRYFNQKIQCP